jgi:hypothetical protein
VADFTKTHYTSLSLGDMMYDVTARTFRVPLFEGFSNLAALKKFARGGAPHNIMGYQVEPSRMKSPLPG